MISLKYLKSWVLMTHVAKYSQKVVRKSISRSSSSCVTPFLSKPGRRESVDNCCRIHQSCTRHSCMPATRALPFHHDENMNAARILKTLPNYKGLMFEEDEAFERASSGSTLPGGTLSVEGNTLKPGERLRDSVTKFIEASFESQEAQWPVTHPRNEHVVKNVLKELKELNDQELCQVLYHCRWFAPTPSAKDPSYLMFWKALDKECQQRSTSWSIDHSFTVADLWYGIGLARLSEFHWTLLKKLFRKCDKLRKEHFVRFMFCLNLNREIPPNANSYDLEYSLNRLVDQLVADELVIIGMGFFKTQRNIRDPTLLKKVLLTVMKSAETLDSVSVSALSKLARYSSDVRSADINIDFQKKFVNELPRLSTTACTHLALIGTNSLSAYNPLIENVVNRIESNISEARLKELERICFAATMFNIDCGQFYQLLVKELQAPERADEIRKYGRSLPAILHYLSIKDIFLPDLMSTCLSKPFRDTYYGRSKEIFQRELVCLDVAADVDIKDYNGNRLEPKILNAIIKRNMLWLKSPLKHKVSMYEKTIRNVTEIMFDLMKDKELFYLCNILPQHHTMTIVYCRNKDGKLVPIPEYFYGMAAHEIKKIGDSELDYHSIVLCSRGSYIYNTKNLTGQANLQIRQIKRLGYKTHVLSCLDWETLTDINEKRNILEKCIS